MVSAGMCYPYNAVVLCRKFYHSALAETVKYAYREWAATIGELKGAPAWDQTQDLRVKRLSEKPH